MIKKIFACVVAALTAVAMMASDSCPLSGSWRGKLALGPMKLPLVFNFSTESGHLQCTLDSPSQGAKGIPVEVVLCTADSLSLSCPSIGATYSGRISSSAIKGDFSQRGYTFPLNLAPDSPNEDRRPQTPRPPYPYTVIDTVFTAPDGAVMSATLTLPAPTTKKKVPAVVMVTGSGPQNRDEEIFDHKPFAVIADYLARNGVASLRYDDRGVAKSTGDFLSATTFTFKDDAKAAVKFLRTFRNIGKVGVLGHSEGGTIAFMLGAESVPDFIVSLAGLSVSGKDGLLRQNRHAMDAANLSQADKEAALQVIGRLFDTLAEQHRQGKSSPVDVDSLVSAVGVDIPSELVTSLKMTQKNRTPWMDALLAMEPAKYLRKIKCPMLAVNGDKDTQVYPDNLTLIQQLVPKAKTLLMPGLNHLMQHASTGEVAEYDQIRETMSPEVLDAVLQFILNLR